jgi:hypothetical protein
MENMVNLLIAPRVEKTNKTLQTVYGETASFVTQYVKQPWAAAKREEGASQRAMLGISSLENGASVCRGRKPPREIRLLGPTGHYGMSGKMTGQAPTKTFFRFFGKH